MKRIKTTENSIIDLAICILAHHRRMATSGRKKKGNTEDRSNFMEKIILATDNRYFQANLAE